MVVCEIFSLPAETRSRVNRSVPLSSIDWPNVQPNPVPTERWFAKDATPAMRVREAFAQFVPGESQSGVRYSSLDAATQ
jgi:hypothetical protein